MSLESQIADLVSAANSLITTFSTKKAGIDAAVAAAISATPEMKKIWNVDPVGGLDTNAGTAASPLKTINKAIANTPVTGVCQVQLLGDYVVDSPIAVNVGLLRIVGDGAKRGLNFKYFYGADAASALGGFVYGEGCQGMEIANCTLALPTITGVAVSGMSTRGASAFRTYGATTLPTLCCLGLNACTVTKAADFVGALITTSLAGVSLQVSSTTFPSDMAGKYIGGIAAGTNPNTLSNILTNLASL